MLSKEEFLIQVRDKAKFFLENKKIIPTPDLIWQAVMVLLCVAGLSIEGVILSQLYDFAIVFPCIGVVLLLWFIKKVVSQQRCVYRLKQSLIDVSLSICAFQRVRAVFKKDFLEKSKIVPEKYHFDFEFKGESQTKQFYGKNQIRAEDLIARAKFFQS